MKKMSDNPAADRPKVNITERSLLVGHGQSKKLADIRNRLQPDVPVEVSPLPNKPLLTGLKSEVAMELNKARTLIDERINQIMRDFPQGKKNRLFGFRFGSVDAIKALPIKSAFKTLAIDQHLVKMNLIADLDFYGHEVKTR